MKKTIEELPAELRALLEGAPKLSELDLGKLGKSIEQLDSDPVWRADYLKSMFVQKVMNAMSELGLSQADVARSWGKSRQYVSKILTESRRVNYTLETLCELGHIVGKKVQIDLVEVDEALTESWPTPAQIVLSVQSAPSQVPSVSRAIKSMREFSETGEVPKRRIRMSFGDEERLKASIKYRARLEVA